MSEKSSLLQFQDALLELLASGISDEEVVIRLKTDPQFNCYRDYVSQFDPDMVAVACELIRKWAIHKQEE